jgi:hypothetical protein
MFLWAGLDWWNRVDLVEEIRWSEQSGLHLFEESHAAIGIF